MAFNTFVVGMIFTAFSTFAFGFANQDGNGCKDKLHLESLKNAKTEKKADQAKKEPPSKAKPPTTRIDPRPLSPVAASNLLTNFSKAVAGFSPEVGRTIQSLGTPTAAAIIGKSFGIQTFIREEINFVSAIVKKASQNPSSKTFFVNDGFESRLKTDADLLAKAFKNQSGVILVNAQLMRIEIQRLNNILKVLKIVGRLTTAQAENLLGLGLKQQEVRVALFNVAFLIQKYGHAKKDLAAALSHSLDFTKLINLILGRNLPPVLVVPDELPDDSDLPPTIDPATDPIFGVPDTAPLPPEIPQDPTQDPSQGTDLPPQNEDPGNVDPQQPPTDEPGNVDPQQPPTVEPPAPESAAPAEPPAVEPAPQPAPEPAAPEPAPENPAPEAPADPGQ